MRIGTFLIAEASGKLMSRNSGKDYWQEDFQDYQQVNLSYKDCHKLPEHSNFPMHNILNSLKYMLILANIRKLI